MVRNARYVAPTVKPTDDHGDRPGDARQELPVVVQVGKAPREGDLLDLGLREAGSGEQAAETHIVGEGEDPWSARLRRRQMPALLEHTRRQRHPRVLLRRAEHGAGEAAAVAEHTARLCQRRGRVRHQHVSPPAEDSVDGLVRKIELLCVEWVPPHGPWDDSLMFVFNGGELTDEQIASLKIVDGELAEFRFCAPTQAAHMLRPYVWRRVQAALDGLNKGRVQYLDGSGFSGL